MSFQQSLSGVSALISRLESDLQNPSQAGDAAAAAPAGGAIDTSDIDKAHLSIVRLVNVQHHPKADRLWLCKVQTSPDDAAPKQLITGLVGHYSETELEGRLVAAILNLKPSKLMGLDSEVMLLAGSHGERVRLCGVPSGSAIGDRVYVDGTKANASPPDRCPPKAWKSVVAKLQVKNHTATFDGVPLRTERGVLGDMDLPDGSEIH